jgi:transcription elongation factor S-II
MYSITNPEFFRNNIVEKLEKITKNEIVAKNIEIGVFNYSIKEATAKKIVKKWENRHFVQLYINRMRSVYMNIKDNDELIAKLMDGDISYQQFSLMTHQEFKPEHWKMLIEEKIKKENNKFTNNIQASTDMYTCRKCKSKRCTFFEAQIRSADEASTIFITCLDCGHNFKR